LKNPKKSKKSHIKHEKFRDRNFSSLDHHPRSGKTLKNPFSIIPTPITPLSWVNECIPNILWACILATKLERPHYLRLFRSVAINIREQLENHKDLFLTHNYLSKFTEQDFDTAFQLVLADEQAKTELSALLLVDCMPDKHLWSSRLSAPTNVHWQTLAQSVAACFDHQSQRATDIRWLKLIFFVITGRMLFSREQASFLEELRLYPDRGDMRSVRPMIRATEIGLRRIEFKDKIKEGTKIDLPPPHQESFWQELHTKTQCLPHDVQQEPKQAAKFVIGTLLDASHQVAEHFHSTLKHTGLDARHDSSFGLVLYAIHLLTEVAASYSHSTAVGRSALRSIVECFITLSYLIAKDNPALWLKHRDHGNGQTKLSFLKNLNSENVPRFIDLELLEALANEDKWLEFQDINLGAWAETNLRATATEARVKDIYDSYYDVCSGYTHGHWSAIRDAAFTTCFNPLHRFHRIPRPVNFGMRSVVDDGIILINRMLDELSKIYPGFEYRINTKLGTDAASV
jgi:hypothetical protein